MKRVAGSVEISVSSSQYDDGVSFDHSIQIQLKFEQLRALLKTDCCILAVH